MEQSFKKVVYFFNFENNREVSIMVLGVIIEEKNEYKFQEIK